MTEFGANDQSLDLPAELPSGSFRRGVRGKYRREYLADSDKVRITRNKHMALKLKPLADRVIVKQSEAEEKTKSGILLPDAAKEKPTKGKVIAAGPGKLDDNGKRMEPGVKVGD